LRLLSAALTAIVLLVLALSVADAAPATEGVPRYDHVFVIVEENKDYSQILDPASAPNIAGLAKSYGNATRFYGEVHPSEANYVAMLGGDTFGIHDDDAFYCHPGSTRPYCDGAQAPGYADHTIHAPHLGDQLVAAGLTWKGYYEDLPAPGSLAVVASDHRFGPDARETALYASKHSGFMNFADVQADPNRAERIVGFDQLDRDLASGALPNFALIVPNQCNEMHGLHGPGVPSDCDGVNKAALIRRGDAYIGGLVRRIQATPAWSGRGAVAIIITFDEGAGRTREGCCAVTPDAPSNYGGGHIPTIVITNHGPRNLSDDTSYNHYSLLRTLEDAFRLPEYLAHAADVTKGVQPMTRLFAVSGPAR
jgi:hypothetical protein